MTRLDPARARRVIALLPAPMRGRVERWYTRRTLDRYGRILTDISNQIADVRRRR